MKWLNFVQLKIVKHLKFLGVKNMKNLKNKSKISTTALIIVLTFAAMFVALPIVGAQEEVDMLNTTEAQNKR